MKTLVKSIVLFCVFLSNITYADSGFFVSPEYNHILMKGSGIFRHIQNAHYPSLGLNVGWRALDSLSIEAGFGASAKRSDVYGFDGATGFLGLVEPVGSGVSTRVNIVGSYIDINGHHKLENNLDLIGSIGLGYRKLNYRAFYQNPGLSTGADSSLKLIYRLGLGGLYMVSDKVGVKSMIRWENTNRLKVNFVNRVGTSVSEYPMRDAVSFSFALVFLL